MRIHDAENWIKLNNWNANAHYRLPQNRIPNRSLGIDTCSQFTRVMFIVTVIGMPCGCSLALTAENRHAIISIRLCRQVLEHFRLKRFPHQLRASSLQHSHSSVCSRKQLLGATNPTSSAKFIITSRTHTLTVNLYVPWSRLKPGLHSRPSCDETRPPTVATPDLSSSLLTGVLFEPGV